MPTSCQIEQPQLKCHECHMLWPFYLSFHHHHHHPPPPLLHAATTAAIKHPSDCPLLGQSRVSSSILPVPNNATPNVTSLAPNTTNNATHHCHITGSWHHQQSHEPCHFTPLLTPPWPPAVMPHHQLPMTSTTLPSNAMSLAPDDPNNAMSLTWMTHRMVGRRGLDQLLGGEDVQGHREYVQRDDKVIPPGFQLWQGGRGCQWCPLFLPLCHVLFLWHVQWGSMDFHMLPLFFFMPPPTPGPFSCGIDNGVVWIPHTALFLFFSIIFMPPSTLFTPQKRGMYLI